jgi:hypothetical protein
MLKHVQTFDVRVIATINPALRFQKWGIGILRVSERAALASARRDSKVIPIVLSHFSAMRLAKDQLHSLYCCR